MKNKKTGKGKKAAVIIVAAITTVLISGYAVTSYSYNSSFERGEYYDGPGTEYRYSHYESSYPRTPVSFISGKNRLQGYIYGPDNNKGLIVFAHGIGGGHEVYINTIIRLTDLGWRVLAYDATGSCESEGSGTIGLSQSVLDLDNAVKFAESDSELSRLPLFTMGHSWGGFAAAAILGFGHNIRASVSISGYYQPEPMLYEEAANIFPHINILLRPFIWTKNKITFGKDSSISAVDAINSTDIPILIVHGTGDDFIGFDTVSVISQRNRITNPNAEYLVLDDEQRNGHNTIFRSLKNQEYRNNEGTRAADEFNASHESCTDEELTEFYNSLDLDILNDVSDELIEQIDSFFSRQLSK